MSKRIDLDLSNIAEGGLQEKVDMEMGKVFENIHDLNTKATAKRKLTITLSCNFSSLSHVYRSRTA